MAFSCEAVRPVGAKCCASAAIAGASGSRCSGGKTASKRFGLDLGRRLARKADFERLLRQGRRRGIAGYTFYMQFREEGQPRLGILVSRRHSHAATQRNRIKRCIREAFRQEQERLGAIDLLVRPPYNVRPSGDMILALRKLLGELRS